MLLYIGQFWHGKKLVNHQLFAKIFLVNIHRYTENVFGIFAKFFLADSFFMYGLPNFPVYGNEKHISTVMYSNRATINLPGYHCSGSIYLVIIFICCVVSLWVSCTQENILPSNFVCIE